MGGRTINCSFIPPLYEGYWFRTQSLLLGNPTNPSMAVLGPLWLYEAVHWQIVPTKEYNAERKLKTGFYWRHHVDGAISELQTYG